MKYDFILFDADNTLFDFNRAEKTAFLQTILSYGVSEDDAERCFRVYHAINVAIWDEMDEGRITQSELKVERFYRLAQALRMDFDPQAFSQRYVGHLADASFLLPHAAETVGKLAVSHHLFIVTNGLTSVQEKRVCRSSIACCFDNIVISEEAGVAKPDPRIFGLALKNFPHCDKAKAIMVGDGLATDIRGGINFGIDTCWMNLFGRENETDIHPTYEITALPDLIPIVE